MSLEKIAISSSKNNVCRRSRNIIVNVTLLAGVHCSCRLGVHCSCRIYTTLLIPSILRHIIIGVKGKSYSGPISSSYSSACNSIRTKRGLHHPFPEATSLVSHHHAALLMYTIFIAMIPSTLMCHRKLARVDNEGGLVIPVVRRVKNFLHFLLTGVSCFLCDVV